MDSACCRIRFDFAPGLEVPSNPMNEDEKLILQDLADALQTASLQASRLRKRLGSSIPEAIQLEAETDRAVRLIKRLQPKDEA